MKKLLGPTPVSPFSRILLAMAFRLYRVPIIGPIVFALAEYDAGRYGRLDAKRGWPPAKA